jgi:hypothetical protein
LLAGTLIVAREEREHLLRVHAEVLRVRAEEATRIDGRRDVLELLRLERFEVTAGNACVSFCVFEGQAAGFACPDKACPEFTHARSSGVRST